MLRCTLARNRRSDGLKQLVFFVDFPVFALRSRGRFLGGWFDGSEAALRTRTCEMTTGWSKREVERFRLSGRVWATGDVGSVGGCSGSWGNLRSERHVRSGWLMEVSVRSVDGDGKGIKLATGEEDSEDEKVIQSLELTFASETVQVGGDFLERSLGMLKGVDGRRGLERGLLVELAKRTRGTDIL